MIMIMEMMVMFSGQTLLTMPREAGLWRRCLKRKEGRLHRHPTGFIEVAVAVVAVVVVVMGTHITIVVVFFIVVVATSKNVKMDKAAVAFPAINTFTFSFVYDFTSLLSLSHLQTINFTLKLSHFHIQTFSIDQEKCEDGQGGCSILTSHFYTFTFTLSLSLCHQEKCEDGQGGCSIPSDWHGQ